MPIRVPKLAVRNRTADYAQPSQTADNMSYTRSEGNSSGSASVRSYPRIATPTSSRSASDDNVPTRGSLGSHDGSQTTRAAPKKKKKGMLGFLTLKEPSTNAWAEFAAAEKEKAKEKGIDAAQQEKKPLPDNVPKVNSKWDGLPDSAKRKSISAESKTSSRAHRDSTLSNSTRRSDWTAKTSMSSSTRETMQRFGVSPQSPRSAGRPSTQSTQPFSPYDYRVYSGDWPPQDSDQGPEKRPIEESEENRPQTFLLPPSPEGHDKIVIPDEPDLISPLLTPPELEKDDLRYPHELGARMSSDTDEPSELPAVPLTPPADSSDPILVGIHYPELDSPSVEHHTAAYDFGMPNDSYDQPPTAAVKRRTINFSRPRGGTPGSRTIDVPSLSIDEVTRSASPAAGLSSTLKNADGKIEPFPTETFANHSRETGHIPQRIASTIEHSSRSTDAPITPISPDSDSEADAHDSYPDEPDFTTDSPSTPRTTTYPAAQDVDDAPERSGSQVSLTPSYAPSAMSESWNLSPKERLGLGSRVRRSEVLPWETASGQDAEPPSSPLSDNKRKRLSLRLSSRK